jgi:hypothetical protein
MRIRKFLNTLRVVEPSDMCRYKDDPIVRSPNAAFLALAVIDGANGTLLRMANLTWRQPTRMKRIGP